MTAISPTAPAGQAPVLRGQPVLVIGGSAGIGLATARAVSIAAFDATDFARMGRFFEELPGPVDHVLLTGPGPYYAPLAEFEVEKARRDLESHLLLPIEIAR